MGGIALAQRRHPLGLRVDSLYRGWLSTTERGEFFLVSEGDLMKRLARDWARFGPDARIRFFSSTSEFPAAQLTDEPWKSDQWIVVDKHISSRGFDLATALRPLVGKFVHLEVEWRK
jgi:hypothetical protein